MSAREGEGEADPGEALLLWGGLRLPCRPVIPETIKINAVAVYCSASADVDPAYAAAAREVGAAIAREGWALVYGGNRTGNMHDVAEGARSAGGKVIGVTPQLFIDRGVQDMAADELVVTANMRDRKRVIEERADAFIALPGGLGTYEELFEQLVARQLQYHAKPIAALNVRGYFKPLRDMLEHGIEGRFIKPKARGLIHFAETVADAIAYLKQPHGRNPSLEALSHEAAGGH